MSFKDLREFVSFLEQRGELKRVTAPVSSELEITEITDRMVKSGGPALLFRERGRGDNAPADKHLRLASADGAGPGGRGYRGAVG